MPQELHVVQCYSCHMYQVDIVKKAQTWTCKICHETQSLKRVFFKGSGKECRVHVQELNALKGSNDHNYQSDGDVHQLSGAEAPIMEPMQNKWSKFIESSNENDSGHLKDFSEPSVRNMFQSESSKETTLTNHSIEKSKKTENHSLWKDFIDNNDASHLSEEYDDPVKKKRKIDSDTTKESKWNKYLPDNSDDSN